MTQLTTKVTIFFLTLAIAASWPSSPLTRGPEIAGVVENRDMKLSDEPMRLGRCILAGLFTGMITSIIIIIFNVIYRGHTNLIEYAIVMPISIFTFFPFINLIAGGAYFLFVTHLRRGQPLFILATILGTILIVLLTAFVGNTTDPSIEKFRGLLIGLELINGVMAAATIPFFANHPTIFLTDKDIRGEE